MRARLVHSLSLQSLRQDGVRLGLSQLNEGFPAFDSWSSWVASVLHHCLQLGEPIPHRVDLLPLLLVLHHHHVGPAVLRHVSRRVHTVRGVDPCRETASTDGSNGTDVPLGSIESKNANAVDATRYVAEHSRANVMVVEDEGAD